jgi:UPF0755 protein
MIVIRRILLTGLTMLLLAAASAGIAYLLLQQYLDTPLPGETAVIIAIPEGAGMTRISGQLERELGLRWPRLFAWWSKQQGLDRSVRTGEYQLVAHITPRQLLALLTSGRQVQYPITLIEGWTIRQSLDAIWSTETLVNTLQGLSDDQILQALQSPLPALEGSLFPDTYFHTRGTRDIDVLRRAHLQLLQVLEQEWDARAPDLPYESSWEALIMASIIERESGYQAEKADISGVFVRRLRLGMRLQSDPTVIYGMGEQYQGVIRRSDLNTATPWNTYRIPGLPPTPIALSGRDSIRASLQPASGTALYFVSRGDGSHQFSDTLDEHNAAVRRYLRNPQRNATE